MQPADAAIINFNKLNLSHDDNGNAMLVTLVAMMPMLAACCASMFIKIGGSDLVRGVLHSNFSKIIVEQVPLFHKFDSDRPGAAPRLALYSPGDSKIYIADTQDWWCLGLQLSMQITRAAILMVYEIDVYDCAKISQSPAVNRVLQDLVNELSESVECLLYRAVFSKLMSLNKKAPDLLDRQGFLAVCRACGQESTSQIQFIHLLLLRTKRKLRVLDLITVTWILGKDDRTVYGQHVAGADAISRRIKQPRSITAVDVGVLREGLPVHLIRGQTNDDKVGSAAEFMTGILVSLHYNEEGELAVPVAGHQEAGDHTDVLVCDALGLQTFECKGSLAPAHVDQKIWVKLTPMEYAFCKKQQQNASMIKIFNVPISADDDLQQHPRGSETLAVIIRGPFKEKGRLAWQDERNWRNEVKSYNAYVGRYLGPQL